MTTQAMASQKAGAQQTETETGAVARPRLQYIDNLRLLLIILVILFHLAITYGAVGGWIYQEEGRVSLPAAALMSLFVAVCQAFFMGFFFAISGYFTPAAYDRKGPRPFLVDRLKRLGIPLLFYEVVIHPLATYLNSVTEGFRGSLWQYLVSYFGSLRSFADGPLWFVEALLVFAFLYVLWRLLAKWTFPPPQDYDAAPNNVAVALFALSLGLTTFVVRMWFPVGWWLEPLHWQLAHWPQYIALYILGILAYRRNWPAALSPAQGRVWGWVALGLSPLWLVIAVSGGATEGNFATLVGGVYWQALAYSFWEQFMCLALVVALLVWFRDRFNRQGRLASASSGDTYAVYILFALVIVPLAVALRGIRLDMGLKFVLVSPVAVVLCFLVAHYVRKLPLVRDIL